MVPWLIQLAVRQQDRPVALRLRLTAHASCSKRSHRGCTSCTSVSLAQHGPFALHHICAGAICHTAAVVAASAGVEQSLLEHVLVPLRYAAHGLIPQYDGASTTIASTCPAVSAWSRCSTAQLLNPLCPLRLLPALDPYISDLHMLRATPATAGSCTAVKHFPGRPYPLDRLDAQMLQAA